MRAKYLTLFASALISIGSLNASAHADTIHVAAAANLQKVFDKAMIPAFTKATGITVVPTYGSTKLLATQLENGAPVDVFVAADKSTPDNLVAKGELVASTERVYAFGKLVLWSRADAPMHPTSLDDLRNPALGMIAVANPKLAPYGEAALQALAQANLTGYLKNRLVFAENIGQTLQFAQSGNATVAMTALSLVIDDKKDPYYVVPDADYKPIAQAAAVVQASTEQADGKKFLDFLSSPAAVDIWKQYGYGLPQ